MNHRSFEKIKKELVSLFSGSTIRFDRPEYLEIDISASVISNEEVKRRFNNFLINKGLTPLDISKPSPHIINPVHRYGCYFVCDDADHRVCHSTMISLSINAFRGDVQ